MKRSPNKSDVISQEAAQWVLRHDRGLTATEQDEFSAWLAADARCREAWAEHRWGWDELDRLAGLQESMHAVPDPDLLARPRRHRAVVWLWPLAAAAVVTLGVFLMPSGETKPIEVAGAQVASVEAPVIPLIEERELPDGSIVKLNRGAIVDVYFTETERRALLRKGEAHFRVKKDPARPFYVEASGVSVRAIGTSFNVRMDSSSVEVLVTEGKVQVAASPEQAADSAASVLSANERTVVYLIPFAPVPQVTPVPEAEVEERLSWQPKMLDFTDAPVTEIVAEFNRRNAVRMEVSAPALQGMHLSATLRSDNVMGFVRLLENEFGVRAVWKSATEVELKQAQ
ncbi:MAG: FecR domain-containing protein [Opitutaceae bacterium]|nr:FecR domain-containing protein [Opitutaceae bacterium]